VLIVAMVVVHTLQHIFLKLGGTMLFEDLFSFSQEGLFTGFIWTPLSYAFLHSTASLLHILINLLMLYLFGRAVVMESGSERMVLAFLAGALGGAILHLLVHLGGPDRPLVGASAGVSALLTVFVLQNPEREMQLFLLPITFKAKHFLIGIIGITLFSFLFFELSGQTNVGHAAHLGGFAGGFLYLRFFWNRSTGLANREFRPSTWFQKPAGKTPREERKPGSTGSKLGKFTINLTNRRELKNEVDRILDKINDKGFGALTPEERKTLDDARETLGR
jgi:membrane associated rhomboid family serine protease